MMEAKPVIPVIAPPTAPDLKRAVRRRAWLCVFLFCAAFYSLLAWVAFF